MPKRERVQGRQGAKSTCVHGVGDQKGCSFCDIMEMKEVWKGDHVKGWG